MAIIMCRATHSCIININHAMSLMAGTCMCHEHNYTIHFMHICIAGNVFALTASGKCLVAIVTYY